MRNLAASGALAAALALIATPLAAETAPPMTAQDLVTLPRLGAPAVNAAGTLAIYGVTTTDPESLARSTGYYLLDLTKPAAAPVALAFGIKASSLTFGPDGQIYFLSSQHPDASADARGRVWRVTLGKDGSVGAPQLVAGYPDASIAGFKLAPNGAKIALGPKCRVIAPHWAAALPRPRTCPAPAPDGCMTDRAASIATGTAGRRPARRTACSCSISRTARRQAKACRWTAAILPQG